MADDKLRKEILYMVRLTTSYDFTKKEVVDGILTLENERQILGSVFGKRFKARISDISNGRENDGTCVICGKPAENHVICKHCLDTVGESPYVKGKQSDNVDKDSHTQADEVVLKHIKEKAAIFKKVNFRIGLKKSLKLALMGLLLIILGIQIWIFSIWKSLPSYNKQVEPRVSTRRTQEITTKDQAYKQLANDFPKDKGYEITYARMDTEYIGRFSIDKGECCEEVEENLSDEERYNYFYDLEDVYIFYITKIDDVTGIVGLAEVNNKSQILVCGSFNDGRKTDCHYRFR